MIACVYMESAGFAQEKEREKYNSSTPLKDRIFFGGNLGLTFGDVTLIDISPLVGYKITPSLIAGVGFTYQYYEDKRYTPAYQSNVYGTRLFGRYYTPIHIFFHTEYEWLTYKGYDLHNPPMITENNFYVGGGYSQQIGGRAGVEILILYNLNQGPNSLYANPILRMGIGIGI